MFRRPSYVYIDLRKPFPIQLITRKFSIMRNPIPEIANISNFKSIKKIPFTELKKELKPFQKFTFKSLPYHPLNITLSYPNSDLGDHTLKNLFLLFKFFLRDEDFEKCAMHINLNADWQNAQRYFKTIPHKNGRHWQSICRGEMKIFIEILEYMGLHGMQGEIEGYWNTDPESSLYPAISNSGLGCSRFQQIQRYFKVSSVNEEDAMDMKGEDWFRKVDPFFTRFRKRAHEALVPEKDVIIDELLVQAERRSLHTFQIPNKAAGKGYKVYALCVFGYLFDFVFTSRTEKIAEVKKVREKRLTTIMIKQLMHTLPYRGEGRVLWIDNFFNTADLLCDLKREGIGGAGIAKAGAGFFKQFLYLRTTLTKNDWGY